MKLVYGYSYDLFVIGGGSGGMAASKAAAALGVKVGLADFVKPTVHGTTWGTGGTCVNVGCVPKKMMHIASQLGDVRKDQTKMGWSGIEETGSHDWNRLVQTVQSFLHRLNKMHENNMRVAGVEYLNKLARLIDPNHVELTDSAGKQETISAEKIIIAVGSRPKKLKGIDPSTYITSDDLFSMTRPPGKTLVVGGSYVALECAGFLQGLGYPTELMVRSTLLRKFDRQMANSVGQYMEEMGTKFHYNAVPHSISTQNKQRLVKYYQNNQLKEAQFDTVIAAIGREADIQQLGLEQIGVQVSENNKIIANEQDQTSVKNIYAVGDCVEGRLELTPTAIMCSRRLVNRLFNNGTALMSYKDVATTIFTPLEYGFVGLSEEEAIQRHGKENLQIFENVFKPVTWNISRRNPSICQGKLVVEANTNKILGLHYIGPDAAEVLQGFAVAIKMGATKADLDNTVGIHPSAAEEIVQMKKFR